MGTTIQSAAESVPITEITGLKQFGLGHISYWFSSISQLRKTSQTKIPKKEFIWREWNFSGFQRSPGLSGVSWPLVELLVGENGPGKASVFSFHTNFQSNSKGSSVTTVKSHRQSYYSSTAFGKGQNLGIISLND